MNLIVETRNGHRDTAVASRFSSLLTADSALFTSSAPLFPRIHFWRTGAMLEHSGPGLASPPAEAKADLWQQGRRLFPFGRLPRGDGARKPFSPWPTA
jgi:hypothetical protein